MKSSAKKSRLTKVKNQNKRVPVWVTAKTARRIKSHPKRHSWRQSKLRKG